MLEGFDRANLLVVALDDRRQWYRYHRLFADVLRAHLEEEQSDRIPELHRRASEWYEQHGERLEAIRHALAGGDVERTADLVESALPEMRRARQEMQLRAWVDPLPDEVVRRRPVLSVTFAGALLASGELAGVEDRLDDAELRMLASRGAVAGDEVELRRVPGHIAMYRAALAQVRGDVPATVEHAQQALKAALEDDHLVRAGAAGFLGIALWTGGEPERRIGRGASASRGSSEPGTSRTHSGPPSPWATSASSRGASATRCAPTSTRWRSCPSRVERWCGGRPTCTPG